MAIKSITVLCRQAESFQNQIIAKNLQVPGFPVGLMNLNPTDVSYIDGTPDLYGTPVLIYFRRHWLFFLD